MRLTIAFALALLAGCSDLPAAPVDAPPPIDAPEAPPIDAPPPPTPTRIELVGGGRMTGGALVVDVQLGHPTSQAPASGNATVLEPATPIKP